MSSINGIIDTAKRALMAQQNGLQVTGHNISNVNTDGYTRQRLVLEATRPIDRQPGQLGTGVYSREINRYRDQFIDFQLRRESQSSSRYKAESESLAMVENIFGEPSDQSLAQVLDEFWNTWEDLANDPDSMPARTVVMQKALQVIATMKKISDDLGDLQDNLNQSIESQVVSLNDLSRAVADLNDRIVSAEAQGQNANDLRDQRDLLLDQMAEIANISYQEGDLGDVTVYVGSTTIVERNHVHPLEVVSGDMVNDHQNLRILHSDGGMEARITSGDLAGMLAVRDQHLPRYHEQLDLLATRLAENVNSIHQQGYDLNGISGMNFFAEDVTGVDTLAVNSEVEADLSLIAVSADGNQGDGSLALVIAGLGEQADPQLGGGGINEYYRSMVSGLGVDSANAALFRDQQEAFVQELEGYQQSISGVSLDEEMAQMILYQQAYQAAARVISAVDEMMQMVISIK